MKTPTLLVSILVLLSASIAFAGSDNDRTHRPCFHVAIQNQPENESSVKQNCDWNFSRTVQAGSTNVAQTVQGGRVNDNKVRQYKYDGSGNFALMRGR